MRSVRRRSRTPVEERRAVPDGSLKKIADRDRRDLDTDNGTSDETCIHAYTHTRRQRRRFRRGGSFVSSSSSFVFSSSSTPRLLSLTHNRVPLTHRGVRQPGSVRRRSVKKNAPGTKLTLDAYGPARDTVCSMYMHRLGGGRRPLSEREEKRETWRLSRHGNLSLSFPTLSFTAPSYGIAGFLLAHCLADATLRTRRLPRLRFLSREIPAIPDPRKLSRD